MKLECWIYVTTEQLADRKTTLARLRALDSRLGELAAERPGLGYSAVALFEPSDFLEEDVERELVESVSEGQLPVLYLNLTYDRDKIAPGEAAIAAVLSEFGFRFAITDRAFD